MEIKKPSGLCRPGRLQIQKTCSGQLQNPPYNYNNPEAKNLTGFYLILSVHLLTLLKSTATTGINLSK